jgi:hypothetical protein
MKRSVFFFDQLLVPKSEPSPVSIVLPMDVFALPMDVFATKVNV